MAHNKVDLEVHTHFRPLDYCDAIRLEIGLYKWDIS